MYCSTCRKSLNDNLNYCNSCGARVESKPVIARNPSSMLGIGAVFVGGIGLIVFVPLLRELLRSSLDTSAVIVLLIAYLLTVLAMFAVLILQGRRNSSIHVNESRTADGFGGPDVFRGINTAQLHEPREPIMSVTDHTTRTLDKVPAADR